MNQLVYDLYLILTSSISNERFYGARVTGFRNELEFGRLAKERGLRLLDGGQFLFGGSVSRKSPANFITYTTISQDSCDDYTEFYSLLSKLSEIRAMFFVRAEAPERWGLTTITVNDGRKKTQTTILEPVFEVFRFHSGSWEPSDIGQIERQFVSKRPAVSRSKPSDRFAYLISDYQLDELVATYCNRYFLDVTLGGFRKGMIDLDGMLPADGGFILVETKEKDPMRNKDGSKWGFGWDSRRLSWYLYLKLELGLDAWYVIREVDNQRDRNFVAWKKTDLRRFCQCVSWLAERTGGGGGGTIEAPYAAFEDL